MSFDALTPGLMLRAMPGVFCVGEMLDWEAPTGGYLLTACMAGGLAVADGVAAYLGAPCGIEASGTGEDGRVRRRGARGQVADHLADHGWRAVLGQDADDPVTELASTREPWPGS